MTRPLPAVALVLLVLMSTAARAAANDVPASRPWLEGLSMVELETDDDASLHRALALIQSRGGHIGIVSPPSLLIGWIPYELRDELVGEAGIRDIYVSEVLPGDVEIRDRQTRHMVESFNAMTRGDYVDRLRRRMESTPPQQEWPDTDTPDGILPDARDRDAYLKNLVDNGFDARQFADGAALYGSNSQDMSGTSTVTLMFVESDGSGTDPNWYTWTDAAVQNYIDGVNAGLLWWSDRANNFSGCWSAFFVRYYPPSDVRCQQWREMVLHPSGDVAAMASEVMGNFGYNSGTALARTDAFNTAQRINYGTDWAYTAYIAYNPPPAAAELTDGTSAFAYLGGSYTFLLYRSYSWPVDQVFTHETGHIYGACDEYLSSGCSCAAICNEGVINGNCEACGGGACMMRNNSFALCVYTDDHLGWQKNPCAPASLTPPTASSITPASARLGETLEVTVAGSDFLYGAFADLGAGVTVTPGAVIGSDSLRLTLQIDNEAALGPRNVTVSNRDLQSSVIANGFTVLTSTRHYVSPTGGNVFPYVTAGSAATSFSAAVAAAADGDTVFVESAAITVGSINVVDDLWLSGAWNASFTARDVVSGKTTLQLAGNISFISGGSGAGVDGFILDGGHGTFAVNPQQGYYGGGVRVELTSATIRNCEIRNCDAASSGFGGGGGIAVNYGTVTVENTLIEGNTATNGGGIYMHSSGGILIGNTITGNDVSEPLASPEGGGIYLEDCSGVTLSGNIVDDNVGASRGGGITITNCTGVVIDGGSVAGNAANSEGGGIAVTNCAGVTIDGVSVSENVVSSYGGGMHVRSSQIDVADATFDHNVASNGGAVMVRDTSDVSFADCKFSWNRATFGAGLQVDGGVLDVLHNLFVGNTAVYFGGAINIANLTGGEIAGNTMDRNVGALGGGGILMGASSIEVYNNIVALSTGDGVLCTSGAPVFSYNLVWGSSGADYNGCVPGPGSISADPVFADTTACDYHLGLGSPAIDAGRVGAPYDDPDGSPGDMGRYGSHALVMDQPVFPTNLTAWIEGGSVMLRWDTNPEPDIAGYAVYCDTLAGFSPGTATLVTFVAAPDTSVDLGATSDSAYYRIAAVDTGGYSGGYSNEVSTGTATAVGRVAYSNRLYPNVPNPFNPVTTIRFEVAVDDDVALVVYDVAGRVVRRLVSGRRGPGIHDVEWDGRNDRGRRVSSGVYFYRLTTGRFSETRKMVMLK